MAPSWLSSLGSLALSAISVISSPSSPFPPVAASRTAPVDGPLSAAVFSNFPRDFSCCLVTRLADGDSLTCAEGRPPNDKVKVRIYAADAFETPRGRQPGQPLAQEGKELLSKLVAGTLAK
eukprot:GHVT01064844.1.p4 GENE.GHVT01064844.1~~GHVT01064844.1.p4  ORF type:complete len:121 (+),score=24.16 GHVT01064844.1:323-685(+)